MSMMYRSAARVERRHSMLPLTAAVCALLVASRARGDADDRVRLSWTAPAGCPRADDVRARISELAGKTPADDASIEAEATITRTHAGRLHLTLVVHSGSSVGQRDIEANACEDLAGATAVNLALLLRSGLPPMAAGPERAPPPSVDTRPPVSRADSAANAETVTPSEATRATRPATLAPQERSTRSWRVLARVPLVAASVGLLPSASWGAALALGVQVERWNLLLDGGAWLRQSLSASDVPDVAAHLDRMELGLRACHTFSFGALELAPCARLSLQHIWTRGAGAHITARTAQTTWLAIGVGGQTRWSISSRLGLVAAVDVQAQTARPKIMIDALGRIGQIGSLALTLFLGTEWIL
jgi:hypothetical protein